jgi:hypothetical protein
MARHLGYSKQGKAPRHGKARKFKTPTQGKAWHGTYSR